MDNEQYLLHSQIELKHWWFKARRFIVCELVRYLVPPGKGEVVLDFGCGTGGNTLYLANDYSAYGIDSSLEAIAFAKDYQSDATFLHVEPEEMQESHVQDIFQSAEIILLMDVLEHVEFDAEMLVDLISSSKPGAYIIITVPADMKLWSEHDVAFGHYRRYDLNGLEKLWQDQPVTSLMCSYFNNRLQPIVKFLRFINRTIGSTRGAAGTDLKMGNSLVNRLLTMIFSGESRCLCKLLKGERDVGYSKGVSLIAVLQKNSHV
jgi:SAM-dependent methyltransferase